MKLLPCLLLLFIGTSVMSCAVNEHYRDGELVGRSVGLGLALAPDCSDGAEVFRSRVYGLGVSTSGATLGYGRAELTCVPPDDCRAFFFVETAAEVERILQLVGDLEQVCVSPVD